VRVPLSWLRDFAPFEGTAAQFSAALDDLGLVVEGIEVIGEGLSDIVVARVEDISAIEGADRIRLAVVDAGGGPVEVVCGATNFAVGDLVALAPVGAVLPGDFKISRRKMKGVVSNGMLCSGRELKLSDDHEGILRLNDVAGVEIGQPLMAALGIEVDLVFNVAVEANRPDAWSMAGVARDLAARLGLPFEIPPTSRLGRTATGIASAPLSTGQPIDELASVRVDDVELCPRLLARVVTGIEIGQSPEWVARRLTLAGMRPINNVVDASNYVMLELGQPTHPYDLDRLGGHGLLVRRASPGETVTTLDGVARTLGRPGPGLGDTGQDCLICDAEGTPVGIGGVMGGASSEIDDSTSRVLLEVAYFVPMAIARTSKRLNLRTEASARFERGCDPAGIDRAAERFCELLALTAGPTMTVGAGSIDVVGEVPKPVEITVRPARINALLGTEFTAEDITGLLSPLGIDTDPDSGADGEILVTVPTFRPDIRPAPMGEADIAEEVARTFGYARITRRMPSWPQPGKLTAYQRDRRSLKDVVCGLGCSEAWTTTFVSERDQALTGFEPPYIEVTNPLVESERFLRSSMVPGLVRALVYNTERRQGQVRLFEVGSVFKHSGTSGPAVAGSPPADAWERIGAVFADEGDDAWSAVAAWRTIADAFGIDEWDLGDVALGGPGAKVLHPFRSSRLTALSVDGNATEVGFVGELDPYMAGQFELTNPDGRPRRIGWLDLDIGALLDRSRVRRRSEEPRPISRFPSSDIDLAFVVGEAVPAGAVERTLQAAGGDLLESVELFDVYRGPSVTDGARSLAFRLRFCALDRTLTDEEVSGLRITCIGAVEQAHVAALR
jgi:phenylalanyl-tRNA synthetase beta chain